MRAVAELRKSHLTGCAWFWAWALVGAAVALGFLSLGLLLLVPAAVATWLIARRRSINGFGLLSGVGVVLLVVAYIQRDGPGTTCSRTATSVVCDQHLNPIPWLVAGLAVFTAGLVGHAWRSR
jgi:hypothetical protein